MESRELVAAGNMRRFGVFLMALGLGGLGWCLIVGVPVELKRQQLEYLNSAGVQTPGIIQSGSGTITKTTEYSLKKTTTTEEFEGSLNVAYNLPTGQRTVGNMPVPYAAFRRIQLQGVSGQELAATVLYDPADPGIFTIREVVADQIAEKTARSLGYLGLGGSCAITVIGFGVVLWRKSKHLPRAALPHAASILPASPQNQPPSGEAKPSIATREIAPWEKA